MKSAAFGLAAGLVLGVLSPSLADDIALTEQFAGTNVAFQLNGAYSNVTLSISGPNNFQASAFAKTGAPSIDLRGVDTIEDGVYAYHLTAATGEKIRNNSRQPDNGRDASAAAESLRVVSASGDFQITGGAIFRRAGTTEPSRTDPDSK